MKQTVKAIMFLLGMLVCIPVVSHAQYYYSDNREISLGVDSMKVLVKFTNPLQQHASEWAEEISRIDQWQEDSHVINGFEAFSLSTADGYYSFMDSLDTLPNVELVEPYYTGYEDSALLVGDEFIVAFYGD